MVGPQPLKLTMKVRILPPDPLHDPRVPRELKDRIMAIRLRADEYIASLPGPSVNEVRTIERWEDPVDLEG